nr:MULTISPECIES: diguanylate cyclase [Bacillus]
MGLGIWSMHFIGMVSFQTAEEMKYDLKFVLLSIVAAFAGSLISFYVVNEKKPTNGRLAAGSLAMGCAIASMHFIGMEAMENMTIVYHPVLYAASFAIAIFASFAALKLSVVFAKKTGSFRILFIKIGSALLMGGAISGMHYTGMSAATLFMADSVDTGYEGIDTVELGIMIVLVSLMLQCFLIFGAFNDKRLLLHIEKVKDNEERFQSLINHNIDPIYVFSLEGKLLSANSSGYSLLEKMGIEPERLSSVFRQEDHDRLLGWFLQVQNEKQAINRDTAIAIAEKRFDLNVTLIPVYVRKQLDSIYVICKDMTNQREAERKIHRMAHYDALTDLPNRRYAVDRLANVLKRQETGTAVLFLDLNRFKVFNDALGHDVGDLLLVAAAQRLAHCVPNEGFIARLGGDEFIIVAPLQGIDQLTRQLISQFETPFRIKEHRLKTSVSIGIAVSPDDGTDGDELMRKADMAMYAAKYKSVSRYRYFSSSLARKNRPSFQKEIELN